MTQRGYPFDAGEGLAYELDWSLMAKKWRADGIIQGVGTELAVFADSTGMQVKVPIGDAWVRGHYYRNDAQVTQAIAAANATNPRIDRIVLRIDYAANTIRIAAITGVPAGSPVAPAVTQNDAIYEYSLATVLVDAAVGTIAAGKVTNTRNYSTSWQPTEYGDLNLSGSGLLAGNAAVITQSRTGAVVSNHQLLPGAQGVSNQYGLYNVTAARYEWYTTSAGVFVAPQGVQMSAASSISGGLGANTAALTVQNTSVGDSYGGIRILDAAAAVRSIFRVYNSTYSASNNFGAAGASTIEWSAQQPLYIGTTSNNSVFFGTNGAVRLTIDNSGISTFGGEVISSAAIPRMSLVATTGTNSALMRFTNTSGNAFAGLDNSTGTTFGGSGYTLGLWAPAGSFIELIPGATPANRITISTTGASTFRGALTVSTGNITASSGNIVATAGNFFAGTASGFNSGAGIGINRGAISTLRLESTNSGGTATEIYYNDTDTVFQNLSSGRGYRFKTGGVVIETGGLALDAGVVSGSARIATQVDQNNPTYISVTNNATGAGNPNAYAGLITTENGVTTSLLTVASNYASPYTAKGVLQTNAANGLMIQNNNNGPIQFYVNAGGTNNALTLSAAGNLTLTGSMTFSGGGALTAAIIPGNANTEAYIRFSNNGGSGYIGIDSSAAFWFGVGNFSFVIQSPTNFVLKVNGTTTAYTVATNGLMTINQSAIIIGTSSTATAGTIRAASTGSIQYLYFNGIGNVNGSALGWNGFNVTVGDGQASTTTDIYGALGVTLHSDSGGNYVGNSAGFMPSTTNGTKDLGGASNRWGTVYAAVGTINTSHSSAKEDMRVIPRGRLLDLARQTPIYTFKYKGVEGESGDWVHVGFKAEETDRLLSLDGRSSAAASTAAVALGAVADLDMDVSELRKEVSRLRAELAGRK